MRGPGPSVDYSLMAGRALGVQERQRAIRQRQPWNADVIALLWEVKRMHSEVLRFRQLSNSLKRPSGLMGDMYDDLLTHLADEPCATERDNDN